ncbi:VOC family protein [Sphingomonas nostoxanthinifaciens]|uniref:VOC family protein n=1 Tax=Sphingomonas nostoxanthinifaciens TaxID=2872652 RepID=UPI001CC20D1B|nr:VOC family protein [Sphingomonas nostoxanthinifaciens]UAK24767.1 VOC family protein [Sphingomonas nostoxanthinifaciens]
MAFERLGHINIKTSEFDATMHFYQTLFDLQPGPAATMADQDGNAWLHGPDGRAILHINRLDPGDARPVGAVTRLDHVAFDCDDQPGMQARLDAAGIAYRVFATRVPGLVQINLLDPNGIKLELTFGHALVQR